MRDRISVPIKIINSERWGELSALSLTHDICGEVVNLIDEKFSLAGVTASAFTASRRTFIGECRKALSWIFPQLRYPGLLQGNRLPNATTRDASGHRDTGLRYRRAFGHNLAAPALGT